MRLLTLLIVFLVVIGILFVARNQREEAFRGGGGGHGGGGHGGGGFGGGGHGGFGGGGFGHGGHAMGYGFGHGYGGYGNRGYGDGGGSGGWGGWGWPSSWWGWPYYAPEVAYVVDTGNNQCNTNQDCRSGICTIEGICAL